MGSGKSTVGKKLGNVLQLPHVDMDSFIEEQTLRSISTIFSEMGENTFRNYESDVLKKIEHGVVSTGGGIVERRENIEWMKAKGTVIYLRTTFSEITNRLHNDSLRPLWKKSVSERRQLFEHRCDLYESFADYVVDTDNKGTKEIAEEIDRLLNNYI
ncbi:shikimate kinase [Oceanobacillus limi]|nr:shikimate kinase [Oceanobacillus limi]